MPHRRFCAVSLVAMALLVGACTVRGDTSRPIPTVLIPAPLTAQKLVVVLPGRADDLGSLQRSGVVEVIHRHWPDADVLLAELTMTYYMKGRAPRRLHDEVIEPARKRGHREVWLIGASLGGMGSLMYDRQYPGQIDGIILMAPYLGEPPILRTITAASGIRHWDPGPAQALTTENWQHEMWRHLQAWGNDPERTRNVWLAYGDADRMRTSMPVLIPLLPRHQVLERPGGHSWRVWSPALGEVLQAATAASSAR